ncbi:MAG: PKD domain-containing protein [Paludibacteraceae bacterium]|nr:PKD domain-containing protein [Paludibacteraceae bacterium]MBQ2190097.1 PKD domain-containing protein [Paludibacteraceae bacterium]MBQ5378874.1 PKD domain-containing protein [Paludibacteraceae bacterium]
MKKTILLLTLCLALMACKKVNVDFTYSPTEPRAGQSVQFSNLSSAGEEWEWSFGDGTTSSLKIPSHVYKRPGTYRVLLKVDKKNSLTKTAEITVYDTVPTFVCADSVFTIFRNYTFEANVYNPFNYTIEYEWDFPDTIVSTTGNTITCYFTEARQAEVTLRVTMNNETTVITKTFDVQNSATNALLIRTAAGDYRQRIFGERAESALADASAAPLLDAEQDTIQTYNGWEFRLSDLKTVFPELEGFHIANRKIYFRANGLWVANIDGANIVQIDERLCSAMVLDTRFDNRIYWANKDGVWYMPFVGSDNNKFVTIPTLLNELEGVTKLALDNEVK